MLKFGFYVALSLCIMVVLATTGCDSGSVEEEDLFLLNPLRISHSFEFPRDSTVALAPREIEFIFRFNGEDTDEFENLDLVSENEADLSDYLSNHGFGIEDVTVARVLAQGFEIILRRPTSDDLSLFENAWFGLEYDNIEYQNIGHNYYLSSSTRAGLELYGNSMITDFVTSPRFRGRLQIGTRQEAQAVEYELRVRFKVEIVVDATPPLEGIYALSSPSKNIRPFLLEQGFDVGDVRKARAKAVIIHESPSYDPLVTRVNQITVRLRSAGAGGDGVVIGRLREFGEELEVYVDVADVIKRSGRVELLLDLDLKPGGDPRNEEYRFSVEVPVDVEVPQPTAVGT